VPIEVRGLRIAFDQEVIRDLDLDVLHGEILGFVGATIFIVEQNANMALSIANHGYVLQSDEAVPFSRAAHLRQNEMVWQAYLGEMRVAF
jgi:ABC-type branched-subunit amino acid transport system ATPase component